MNERPCFSIILPTKDRPEMLRRAIQSVMHQTFDDYELIIIDDGSLEDNKPLVESFPQAKLTYVKNVVSQGVSSARNQGIALAQGQYISLLDDDDEYLPSFLESTYQTFHQTSDQIGFCWCSIKGIYYSKSQKISWARAKKFPSTYRNIADLIVDASGIATSDGVTFKASCLERFGGFDTSFSSGEDTELFLRLLSQGVIPIVVPGIHVLHHNHAEVRLSKNLETLAKEKAGETLISRYGSFLSEYPLRWSRLYLWTASVYFQSGDRDQGKLIWQEMQKKMSYRTYPNLIYHLGSSFLEIMVIFFSLKRQEIREKI